MKLMVGIFFSFFSMMAFARGTFKVVDIDNSYTVSNKLTGPVSLPCTSPVARTWPGEKPDMCHFQIPGNSTYIGVSCEDADRSFEENCRVEVYSSSTINAKVGSEINKNYKDLESAISNSYKSLADDPAFLNSLVNNPKFLAKMKELIRQSQAGL